MRKFRVFQNVVLKADLASEGIREGSFGTIVDVLQGDGLAVEFFDAAGCTVDVVLIPESLVRLATKEEEAKALSAQVSAPIAVEPL